MADQVSKEDIGEIDINRFWLFARPTEECWRDVIGGPGDAYIMQKSSAHEAQVKAGSNFEIRARPEFKNWGDNVSDTIEALYTPTSKGLSTVLERTYKKFEKNDIKRVRLVGSGHSWAPLFAGKEGCLIMTKNCRGITFNPTTNTVTVSAGDLVYDLEEKLDTVRQVENNNRTLAFTTVETTFSVTGIVAPGCHGSGGSPNFQTGIVGDMVQSITLCKHQTDGTVKPQKFVRGCEEFPALMLNLGAMGVMQQVEFNTIENVMVESKHYNVDMMSIMGHTVDSINALPKVALPPDSINDAATKLRQLMLSHDYLDINWSPFSDTVWVIQITKKPNEPYVDGLLDEKDVLTERWKKAHIGSLAFSALTWNFVSQLATPFVCKESYKNMLPLKYTPENPRQPTDGEGKDKLIPLKSALHWEVTCDAVSCRDLEIVIPIRKLADGTDDFRPIVYAWNAMLQLITAYKQKHRYPVNLFGQIRIVSGSPEKDHALLCPAVNVSGKIDRWCYMECLTTKGNKYWHEFMEEMLEVWLMIDPLVVPHWAKEYPSYTPTDVKGKEGMENFNDPGKRVQNRLHHVYGTNITDFEQFRKKFDPAGMYKNKLIDWMVEDCDKITKGPLLFRNDDEDAGAGNMWDSKWAELAHIQLQLVLSVCNKDYSRPSDTDIAKLTAQMKKEDPQHREPRLPALPFRGNPDEEDEREKSRFDKFITAYISKHPEATVKEATEAAHVAAGKTALREAMRQKAKSKYAFVKRKEDHAINDTIPKAVPDTKRTEGLNADIGPGSFSKKKIEEFKNERQEFYKYVQDTHKSIAKGNADPLEIFLRLSDSDASADVGCDRETLACLNTKIHRVAHV